MNRPSIVEVDNDKIEDDLWYEKELNNFIRNFKFSGQAI